MSRRDTGPDRLTRDAVYARARMRCERCQDTSGPWQVHHRRARGMGGTRRSETNAVTALVLLCQSCHQDVESRRRNALDDGWLVRQSQDPALVPVLIGGALVYLTADGQYDPMVGGAA